LAGVDANYTGMLCNASENTRVRTARTNLLAIKAFKYESI